MSAFLHSAAFQTAAPLFSVVRETERHSAARETLLDASMGPGRKHKSSEALRRGRCPAEGLAFAAIAADKTLVGTVRLWNITAGRRASVDIPALLLGPLAVDASLQNAGIGGALMGHALAEAARLGHGAVLLVGNPDYYGRFGFSSAATANLTMPGPFEPRRLLALELSDGYLRRAVGAITATGPKACLTSKVAGAAWPRVSSTCQTDSGHAPGKWRSTPSRPHLAVTHPCSLGHVMA